ncbi:MAG TPA: response regulator transcription factor [Actinomycetota bacterium]|nr:response regulator transcription factor [Actinomycetota bacterium]
MGNPTSRPITILIVDDERTFGEALQLALRQEKDLKVIDVAVDGDTAMRVVDEQHPDVVIMDVAMPGMNGIEATRRIKEGDPDAQVLILSGHEDPLLLARAVQAGAVGLLRKTEAIVNVASSVRRAYRGESIHEQDEVESAMRRLRHRRDAEADAKRRLERLTPRERQILERMATGMSSEAISKSLNMSPHTLRTHMQNILTKLGVHSKMEALVIAIRHGAVSTVDLTSEDAAG